MRPVFVLIAVLLAEPALAQPEAPPGVPPSMAARPSMASRLAAERVSAVEAGLYSTDDKNSFALQPYGRGKYLLSFTGGNEQFVLTVERGSLGTKWLKYDTGATALRVSVWGGLTLYTRDNPGGVPATRQGDAAPVGILSVSAPEFQTALNDEASHLSYAQKVSLKFSADPAVLAADPEIRGRAFDALVNAAQAIERFVAQSPSARQTLIKRVNHVKVAEGGKPTISMVGQTLLVSFVPSEGHEGHASSLAIELELGRLLTATGKDMASK